MAVIITENDIKKANSYVPIANKEAFAALLQISALRKCPCIPI